MAHTKKWMFMFHGNIFFRYNNQDIGNKGLRGDSKFDVPNWFMGMGQTRVGNRGLFRFSVMLSLDPLTIGGEGYPLLFQSGETWDGKPLVDRQHPHDLFSELSVGYTHMISKEVDVFAYLGLPGEPAFGPVAFMHRVSSLYNPDAPIGHHWQDATHISLNTTTVYGKYEWVEKSTEDLLLDEDKYGHGVLFPVNAISLGIQQSLFATLKTNMAVGAQGSWYSAGNHLEELYGKNPLALQFYLRVYPGLMGGGAGK
jgi:hypothetical protein